MRYLNVDTLSFTNKQGITVPVKDKRELLDEQISFNLGIVEEDELDEIVSREDIYGKGKEASSYKLFDANITAIVDSGYDLDNIRTLKIPL